MYMLSRRKFIQPMAVFAEPEAAIAWLDSGAPPPAPAESSSA